MTKYRLKKDTPEFKAGSVFTRRKYEYGDYGDDCLFADISPGTSPTPAFDISLIDSFDEWFEEIKRDETPPIDVDYLEYMRAVSEVMDDRGRVTLEGAVDYFMLFGEIGAILLSKNGKVSATRIRDGIRFDREAIYFRTFELAQESMVKHSREWKTIAKWEAQFQNRKGVNND